MYYTTNEQSMSNSMQIHVNRPWMSQRKIQKRKVKASIFCTTKYWSTKHLFLKLLRNFMPVREMKLGTCMYNTCACKLESLNYCDVDNR